MKNVPAAVWPEIILYIAAAVLSCMAAIHPGIRLAVASSVTGMIALFLTTYRSSSRTLSRRERLRLSAYLTQVELGIGHKMEVRYEDVAESMDYGKQILRVLEKAGLDKNHVLPKGIEEPEEAGLTLLVKDESNVPDIVRKLLIAFSLSRIPIGLERKSLQFDFVLSVGMKPLLHWKGIFNIMRF